MDGDHTIPLEGANKGPSWPSQAAAKHIQQRACYPPGGRAPRDCHGLPPREIFLQMNLESSALQLGVADMALPVPVPFQRPAALDDGAGDVAAHRGHKPVWQIALLRPQMPEWLNWHCQSNVAGLAGCC